NVLGHTIVIVIRYPFAFFFSSRRRHTRFSRDWSSDVCSSDLKLVNEYWEDLLHAKENGKKVVYTTGLPIGPFIAAQDMAWIHGRSEERRVGKECRLRSTRAESRAKPMDA